MPENKTWIVTTSSGRPISDIKKDLSDAGFSVDQVLEEAGSITGTAPEDAVKKVRSINGVVDVSPDTPIDIGPPDSPDTW
jgi:hypothetical protein